MSSRPVVVDRCAAARSGHTSSGNASCSNFPCARPTSGHSLLVLADLYATLDMHQPG